MTMRQACSPILCCKTPLKISVPSGHCRTEITLAAAAAAAAARHLATATAPSRFVSDGGIATAPSADPAEAAAAATTAGERPGRIVCQDAVISRDVDSDALGAAPFVLPPPSWSLKDLNLGSRPTASAVELGPDQVKKICAIAHIDLDPDGQGGFDAASATRDVGAMLRVMQTMRMELHGRKGETDRGRWKQEEEEEEEGGVDDLGPWGGAAVWAAPVQEDVVSDGNMQQDILASAERTDDDFFTAPRVVGEEEKTR